MSLTCFNIHNLLKIAYLLPNFYKPFNSACSDLVHFSNMGGYKFTFYPWDVGHWWCNVCILSNYFLSLNLLCCILPLLVTNYYQSRPPTVLSWVLGIYPWCMSSWHATISSIGKKLRSPSCSKFWIIFFSGFWYWPFEVVQHAVAIYISVPAISTVSDSSISILRVCIHFWIVLLVLIPCVCICFWGCALFCCICYCIRCELL